MPAATTKAELVAICEREFAKLATLIEGISDSEALRPCEDGATIRDIVGHRAYWIDLWLGWEAAGREGRPVIMPAEGYGWGDLPDLSAAIRRGQSALSWYETRTLLIDRHAAFMRRLGEMTDAELYGHPMVGGNGKWTAGRYAESAGSSHYRSAARVIRRWRRAFSE